LDGISDGSFDGLEFGLVEGLDDCTWEDSMSKVVKSVPWTAMYSVRGMLFAMALSMSLFPVSQKMPWKDYKTDLWTVLLM
jgi:hypothetical protein